MPVTRPWHWGEAYGSEINFGLRIVFGGGMHQQ